MKRWSQLGLLALNVSWTAALCLQAWHTIMEVEQTALLPGYRPPECEGPHAGKRTGLASASDPEGKQPAQPPRIVVVTNSVASTFRWDQLESTNYWTYMANLRNIGCPEDTIRDIVRADVHTLYQRRLEEASSAASAPVGQSSDLQAKIAAILREEHQALVELGVEPHGGLIGSETAIAAATGTVEAASAIESRAAAFVKEREDLMAAMADREPEEVEIDALRRLDAQLIATLGDVSSPEERHRLESEYSPMARALRGTLEGIDVSAEEFKKIYDIRRQLEGALSHGDVDASAVDVHSLDQQVQQILGPERFSKLSGGSRPEDSNSGDLSGN